MAACAKVQAAPYYQFASQDNKRHNISTPDKEADVRFTCRATLATDDDSKTFTIDHYNSIAGQPATTTATVRDEAGLRDLTVVSALCDDDKVITFFCIDGESPDAQRVAVVIDEEESLALVGSWRGEGRTVAELAKAKKTAFDLEEANCHTLYVMTFSG
jgi:hypothetical protein